MTGAERMDLQDNEGGGRLAAVTGVTGFIGGHLAGELTRRGWRLRVLARSMPRFPALAGPPIEVVQGSLSDPSALRDLVEGADAVLHLAGAIKGSNRNDFMAANAEGTAALAEAWRAHAPEARFLYLSSMVAREPGLSHYAASKRAAEQRLASIGAGADWSILRPAVVYGPGDLRGEPYRLSDEQRALLYSLYEVYPDDAETAGRRRFKRGVLSLAKGLAKTELAALIAACELSDRGSLHQ